MTEQYSPGQKGIYEYQTPATLNQANPVQNTWYDILPVTRNVYVYQGSVNIEDNDETLEVQIIVDGETIEGSGVACTNSTNYYMHFSANAIARIDSVVVTNQANVPWGRSFLVMGRSVQIQVRKTTVAGVGNLTGLVMYGVLRTAT